MSNENVADAIAVCKPRVRAKAKRVDICRCRKHVLSNTVVVISNRKHDVGAARDEVVRSSDLRPDVPESSEQPRQDDYFRCVD